MTLRRASFASAFVLAVWTGAGAAAPVADELFPCSDVMRQGVEFWKSVWTRWTLGQAVLHDTEHPAIVYEVFDLPPPIGETYSDEQRAYVNERRQALEARLASIESKVADATPLEDDEKALVLKITEAAGSDAIVGASHRVRAQRGLRERFRRGLEISGRYHDAFVAVFREAGLPEDLVELPHVESSFQVAARSSAGAVGVWQFTRGAARKFLLLTPGLDERLDPVAAARGAARYLKTAYDELGSWPLAITSYNHGIEGMRAARDRFGMDFSKILSDYDGRTFGFASKNFYAEFLAAREVVKDASTYFPEGFLPEAPLEHDRVRIDRPLSAAGVASRYHVPLSTLATINPAWTRKALRGGSLLPAGTEIWLPAGTLARLVGPGRSTAAATASRAAYQAPSAPIRP